MVDHKISGYANLPDAEAPRKGWYEITIYAEGGIAVDGDRWRSGVKRVQVSDTGYAEVELPERTDPERYLLRYSPFGGNSITLGTFDLTADTEWQTIIEVGGLLPPLPSLLGEIAAREAADAELAAGIADEEAARIAADEALLALIASGGAGSSHVSEDVDGVPYYDSTDPGDLFVLLDTDSVPYVYSGA